MLKYAKKPPIFRLECRLLFKELKNMKKLPSIPRKYKIFVKNSRLKIYVNRYMLS